MSTVSWSRANWNNLLFSALVFLWRHVDLMLHVLLAHDLPSGNATWNQKNLNQSSYSIYIYSLPEIALLFLRVKHLLFFLIIILNFIFLYVYGEMKLPGMNRSSSFHGSHFFFFFNNDHLLDLWHQALDCNLTLGAHSWNKGALMSLRCTWAHIWDIRCWVCGHNGRIMKSWISPHLSGLQLGRADWIWVGGRACG